VDPEVTYNELVDAAHSFMCAKNTAREDELLAIAGDVVERFSDLDTWLRRGGYLPQPWRGAP
jgi:hypothetical protein